jgi:hypothetical protein
MAPVLAALLVASPCAHPQPVLVDCNDAQDVGPAAITLACGDGVPGRQP